MRTTLLLSLVSVSFGLAALSLLAVHTIIEKQIRNEISSDLEHSIVTFQNIQVQRRQMLSREAALLADLPVLKSLMTTEDGPTIRDGAKDFYRLSGGDFFALADANGGLVALFQQGVPWDGTKTVQGITEADFTSTESHYVLRDGKLYEVSAQPIYFGSALSGTRLGYVAVGYAVNNQVVREVSESAAAEVIFFADGEIVATTLAAKRQQASIDQKETLLNHPFNSADLWLDREHYIQASVKLSGAGDPLIQLVVLKSYDKASRYLTQLNHLLVALVAFVLLISGALAIYISRTITLPLETLVLGARALGAGNFDYPFQNKGAKEIQELSTAFDRMRTRLQKTQQELLASEQLATIGRMASSISHDLRHYLSAVYANAEFLGYDAASPAERAELLAEVRLGVEGMTELIDSLLLFSRTGQALQPTYESLPFLVERALQLVRAHPDAKDVTFAIDAMPQIEVWMDALKVERAIYNLLLNGSQAAKVNGHAASVHLSLWETEEWIRLYITDNGPGVPDSIRITLFQPFVSEGKQGGAGLGLTLASKIAQEHGGNVALEESQPGRTVFSLSLCKATLKNLAEIAQQHHEPIAMPH
ncbi:HAMP domain-containing protein [Alloacidobacterium dinghuense]|uniref:histidine kinase n=1 Tax=Alloacidobacterium dinghuense TaxID=2763107 RepID=A0A7G8BDX2_9BACT|nr:ATP-binding protein [Alloacidobacterium dinghuense]QNI30742.1 HAMP domain-containing protein [Alloacidobacterium dinghuense]